MKERLLGIYLFLGGLTCVFGLSFAIPVYFGDFLLWQPRSLPTELMISSVYFAMGLVMMAAARNAIRHQALVDFLILANLLHAGVMVIYAENWRHLVLDAGAIGLLGALPLFFYPWGLGRFLRYGDPR